ncbi:hypothetical protein PAPYR_11866 [Paratrimastix pyriformis]|uniref:Uncharacterized protein n=1 Tax=Paratrimastix pyriformis TaxID=342808 RepID=A0ABQ8U9X8_9EUKA|nr:hypothetical protein PAPYR_11866 [Paratrimastix pyriformis]
MASLTPPLSALPTAADPRTTLESVVAPPTTGPVQQRSVECGPLVPSTPILPTNQLCPTTCEQSGTKLILATNLPISDDTANATLISAASAAPTNLYPPGTIAAPASDVHAHPSARANPLDDLFKEVQLDNEQLRAQLAKSRQARAHLMVEGELDRRRYEEEAARKEAAHSAVLVC